MSDDFPGSENLSSDLERKMYVALKLMETTVALTAAGQPISRDLAKAGNKALRDAIKAAEEAMR